jgi:3-deoxy-manno-octulosonate cytidylyltransferase (CMP-KDO synthetase)
VLRFVVPVVPPRGLPDTIRLARVVGIIPSRYQSTRLPGKALADIAGAPMVEHVHRRASEAKLLDAVVVATDDRRIADVVNAFGGTAVMTHASHASGTDRLAEVAAALSGDIVVNIQGDEPTIAPEAIDAAVKLLLDRPADQMATLRRRIEDLADLANPSVVKLVTDAEGYALFFTRSAVPFVRPGHPRPVFWRHPGLYAYRREFLVRLASLAPTPLEQAEGLEQLRAIEHGYRIITTETHADAIGVDTPEDLDRVRLLVEAAART